MRGEWAAAWINDYLRKRINDTVNPIKDTEYQQYVKTLLSDPALADEVMKKAADEDKKAKVVSEKSDKYIKSIVKALIVRNLYGIRYYYESYREVDEAYETAVSVINDNKIFKKFRINN